jgi:hypothetical protein
MRAPRLRRFAIAVAGLSAVLLLGGIAVLRTESTRAFDELQGWIRAEEGRGPAGEAERPVLGGDRRPGRAFGHYESALEAAAGILQRDGDEALLRHRRGQLMPDEQIALRAAWRPAVERLREGARCSDVRPLRPPDPRSDPSPTNLLAARWLVNMSCDLADELLAAGRDVEAVACTLDAATFGADLLATPLLIDKMIGNALVQIGTTEQWTGERLAALTPEALAALAEGLAGLDARLPVAIDLRGELLYSARSLSRPVESGSILGLNALSAWRHGFCLRGQIAAAILEARAALERLAAGAALPWPERETLLEAEARHLEASTNRIASQHWPMLIRVEGRAFRLVAARFRMLRIEVELRLGRDPPVLGDPLGPGPLLLVRDAEGTRVESAGEFRGARLERPIAPAAPR